MNLKNIRKVYMMGIGGIGMSALARYLHMLGKQVAGYDRTPTPLTRQLEAEGIPLNYELDSEVIKGFNLIIYTPALKRNNSVLQHADVSKIPVLKRSEVLGLISRTFRTIAVGGTHGKTTTSALITHLLQCGGIDCTGFVGGIMKNYNSNFVPGKGEWVVVEADEFDQSFLQLNPEIAVITSVDPDHLDIYGTEERLTESFKGFANRLKTNGILFLNDKLQSFAQGLSQNVQFYGLRGIGHYALRIRRERLRITFDYVSESQSIKDIELNFPGDHNLQNALAAISVALTCGVAPEAVKIGLKSFLGIKRRLDVRHISENNVHIDDYAHHPEEIRALLLAVRDMFPGWEVTAIFQPHLYSRTRDFAEGFAETLSLADKVILLEIYPAREEPIEGVTSKMIFDMISLENKWLITKENLIDLLAEQACNQCVILTVGAGDIDTQVEAVQKLVEAWQHPQLS